MAEQDLATRAPESDAVEDKVSLEETKVDQGASLGVCLANHGRLESPDHADQIGRSIASRTGLLVRQSTLLPPFTCANVPYSSRRGALRRRYIVHTYDRSCSVSPTQRNCPELVTSPSTFPSPQTIPSPPRAYFSFCPAAQAMSQPITSSKRTPSLAKGTLS